MFNIQYSNPTSRCDRVVTAFSGIVCFTFLILIALYANKPGSDENIHKSNSTMHNDRRDFLKVDATTNKNLSEENIELPKDTTAVPEETVSCKNNLGGNPAFEHALKDAKHFQKSLATKNTFLKRLTHRLTHREEATRAALVLTGLAILLLVAFLLTKMWKDKEHHAISLKRVVSYPQNDRKAEIYVQGMYHYDLWGQF